MLHSRPNYPKITRLLIDLFNAGELPTVKSIEVEPRYGYVAQINYHNGAKRYVRGAAVDVNTTGAAHIALDKGYSRLFIAQMGYQVPKGRVFLMPAYTAEISDKIARYGMIVEDTSDKMAEYVEAHLGWPCYIKPNDGSRGQHVYRCNTPAALAKALTVLEAAHINLVLVEEAINLAEYRVVIFEDRLIACYERSPLTIYGDGRQTIRNLIQTLETTFNAQGRRVRLDPDDDRINAHIRDAGYTSSTVMARGETLRLLDVANLSAGGTAMDMTEQIHPAWHALCARLTRDLNLRLSGIDLMCADITNPAAAYHVLEINSAPSLSNYSSLGSKQTQVVADLYAEIFNTPPRSD